MLILRLKASVRHTLRQGAASAKPNTKRHAIVIWIKKIIKQQAEHSESPLPPTPPHLDVALCIAPTPPPPIAAIYFTFILMGCVPESFHCGWA